MSETTGYTPPIRPSGSNSIEARVKALEVAQGYDVRDMGYIWQELEDQHKVNEAGLAAAHARIFALSDAIAAAQQKAALWAISALLSAVMALGLIVLKIKAPGLFAP